MSGRRRRSRGRQASLSVDGVLGSPSRHRGEAAGPDVPGDASGNAAPPTWICPRPAFSHGTRWGSPGRAGGHAGAGVAGTGPRCVPSPGPRGGRAGARSRAPPRRGGRDTREAREGHGTPTDPSPMSDLVTESVGSPRFRACRPTFSGPDLGPERWLRARGSVTFPASSSRTHCSVSCCGEKLSLCESKAPQAPGRGRSGGPSR